MNNPELPEEIICEILKYLKQCRICQIYKVSSDICSCVRCGKTICHKCNDITNYNSIMRVYFEVYLTFCRSCYNSIRPKSRYYLKYS